MTLAVQTRAWNVSCIQLHARGPDVHKLLHAKRLHSAQSVRGLGLLPGVCECAFPATSLPICLVHLPCPTQGQTQAYVNVMSQQVLVMVVTFISQGSLAQTQQWTGVCFAVERSPASLHKSRQDVCQHGNISCPSLLSPFPGEFCSTALGRPRTLIPPPSPPGICIAVQPTATM